MTDAINDGRPLLILSLEGLATASIGCYGSSWNQTPAIDALAASGCVFDRWIATHDRPPCLPDGIRKASEWIETWKAFGSTILVSDISEVADDSTQFDTVVQLDAAGPVPQHSADEIDETRLAAQMAAVIEQDSLTDGDWSLMWLHTDVLTKCWDAPRFLFPIDEIELDQEPLEYPDDDLQAEPTDPIEIIPAIMPGCEVPQIHFGRAAVHPDLVTSWMRTYGCQVRLLDLMVEILSKSLLRDDVRVMILGTSGFSLGQNGTIGHRTGPLRSHDCRLPMIIGDTAAVRMPYPTPDTDLTSILHDLGSGDLSWCGPKRWNENPIDSQRAIRTLTDRANDVRTTAGWFYVRDVDHDEHLFLKPDDVEDYNDVARLRPDVVEALGEVGA